MVERGRNGPGAGDFCMMPVEGVLVEGRMPVKAGEGGKGKIGAGGSNNLIAAGSTGNLKA